MTTPICAAPLAEARDEGTLAGAGLTQGGNQVAGAEHGVENQLNVTIYTGDILIGPLM